MRALLLTLLLSSCSAVSTDATITSAFVDEIDDGDARVILDGDTAHVYTIPADILPEGVREGYTVQIVITTKAGR